MSEEDVKSGASSPSEEQQAEDQDESLKTSEADHREESEGEESIKAVPYARFKQINDAKKQAESIANWYRQNIGNPDDVVAFRQWRASQVKQAEQAEAEGEISPQKLAQIRKVMEKANPELAAMLEETKREKEARMEAQFDAAEDRVRELAAEDLGLKGSKDEAKIARIAKNIMLEIQDDPKLLRQWQTGNLDCVKRAFKAVTEGFEDISKGIAKQRQLATEKRRVAKLPTLPSASGSLSQGSGKDRLKGLSGEAAKQANDDAWAILNAHLQE